MYGPAVPTYGLRGRQVGSVRRACGRAPPSGQPAISHAAASRMPQKHASFSTHTPRGTTPAPRTHAPPARRPADPPHSEQHEPQRGIVWFWHHRAAANCLGGHSARCGSYHRRSDGELPLPHVRHQRRPKRV